MSPDDFHNMGIIPPDVWCERCDSYHPINGPHDNDGLSARDSHYWYEQACEQRQRANDEQERANNAERVLNRIARLQSGRQLIREAESHIGASKQSTTFFFGVMVGMTIFWVISRR